MFVSGSKKIYTYEEMVKEMKSFIARESKLGKNIELIIGSDSQGVGKDKWVFATAIVLYCVGNGGVFFVERERKESKFHLSERLFMEVGRSIELAEKLKDDGIVKFVDSIGIHADAGANGKSSKYMNALKAMIDAYGYISAVKPEAVVASTVADRYAG